MADTKRQSMVGKVATPNLKAGGGASKDAADADSNLYKAVGSRHVPLLKLYSLRAVSNLAQQG